MLFQKEFDTFQKLCDVSHNFWHVLDASDKYQRYHIKLEKKSDVLDWALVQNIISDNPSIESTYLSIYLASY